MGDEQVLSFESDSGLMRVEAWKRAEPCKAGAFRKSEAFGLIRRRASPNTPFRLAGVRPFESLLEAGVWAAQVAKGEVAPFV